MKRLVRCGLLLGSFTFQVAGFAETPPPLIARTPTVKDTRVLPPEMAVAHVVLKFHEGTRVRLRGGALVALERSARESASLAALGLSTSDVEADLVHVSQLLTGWKEVEGIARLFGASEEALANWRASGEMKSGRELADLDLFFQLPTRAGTTFVEIEALVEALNAIPAVEIAYAASPPAPAFDLPPFTPDFSLGQGYLDAAPDGIDARYAWTLPGGRGAGVKIVDVEFAWRTSHEDLPPLFYQGGVQVHTPPESVLAWRNHGTAVLGELVAPANGYGVTGIANQAQGGIQSVTATGIFPGNTPNAIAQAAMAAGVGGMVLVELQVFGVPVPNPPGACCGFGSSSQCDYVAAEFELGSYTAIETATANGTIVVEPAGNGAADLDLPNYGGLFQRSVRDSRAIFVGASNGFARSPTCFTNFGSRIDVHGWGGGVQTLGFGSLFNGDPFNPDENQYYTGGFSGTSSAAPIVTGAAAVLQGISLAAGRGNVTPLAMRQLLRDTGTPQDPDARQIGPLPNLLAASTQLLTPPLNAEFLAQSIPTSMVAGEPYAVSVTVKNTGTEAWTTIGPVCNAFRVRSANPLDNLTWGVARIDLSAGVAPGQSATLAFTVRAPATAGTYNFQLQALKECITGFGTLSPNVAVVVGPRQARDVRFLSQSVPASMVAGQSYAVSLTLRNSGTNNWSPIGAQCNAYRLGSANPQDNSIWGRVRADLPAVVPAGGEVTVSFNVTAPVTPGTYSFRWQMVQECVAWFGGLSPNVPVTVRGASVKDAQVLAQSVPKSMVVGNNYEIVVKVKNVGTQTWDVMGPQCNAFRLGAANPEGNTTWGTLRADLAAPVAPGQEATLLFSVTAPPASGSYNFQWRMVHECVAWFGDLSPNVVVQVRGAAARDAQILERSVPSVVTAGQDYPVSLKLKNVGTQSWNLVGPQCNAFRLGGANPTDNPRWGVTRVDLPAVVAPGQEVALNFNIVSSLGGNAFNFQWQMVQECVTWFGDLSPSQLVTVLAP